MNLPNSIQIRQAKPTEFKLLGQLMIQVYAQLEGFPNPQPAYYQMLAHIGDFTKLPSTQLLVAIAEEQELLGGVVYFGDLQYYGAGGIASQEKQAAGFRLLAVHSKARGLGIGKKLTQHCISLAKQQRLREVIIHSTKAMQVAWGMYERLGFERSPDLDFDQEDLPVYGFRLRL